MRRGGHGLRIDAFKIAQAIDVKAGKSHAEVQQIHIHDENYQAGTVKVSVLLYGGGKLEFIWDALRDRLLEEDEDMNRVVPTLIYDPARDMWIVRAPYKQEWINDFKYQLPAAARMWDKPEKVWRYDPMFHDVVKRLCDIHFGGCKEVKPEEPPPPPPPPPPSSSGGGDFLAFLTLCGSDEVKKLYRSAARKHHPDFGGDPKKMQELNVVWDRVSKALGIQ